MSAFDDEFGLFGEEVDESERRAKLGARLINQGETIIDEIEPEDGDAPRRSRDSGGRRSEQPGGFRRNNGPRFGGRDESRRHVSTPASPDAARRAGALLEFLARKLVTKPDDVAVDLFADESGQPVIEVVVDSEDLGKMIGRNGRVAQALRTIARASAEGRIAVDILDASEAGEEDGDSEGPADE